MKLRKWWIYIREKMWWFSKIKENIKQRLLEKEKKKQCKIISKINKDKEIGTGIFCEIL